MTSRNIVKVMALILCFYSCKKYEEVPGVTSLTIFNATNGATTLVTNFKGSIPINYDYAQKLNYGEYIPQFHRFSLTPGMQEIGLYTWPDTLINDKPLYYFPIELTLGSIHSIFLTGSLQNPEHVFIREHFQKLDPADSTFAIRFINLATNSPNLKFTVEGQPHTFLKRTISYKSFSDFEPIAAHNGSPNPVVRVKFSMEDDATLAELPLIGVGVDGILSPNIWRNNFFTVALLGDFAQPDLFPLKLVLISHTTRK